MEFNFVPEAKGVPVVADISSNILSKPMDVSKVHYVIVMPKGDSVGNLQNLKIRVTQYPGKSKLNSGKTRVTIFF